MELWDRILGLTSEHQDNIEAMINIVEENERLKAENKKLSEKISNIEKLIEASMAAIKEIK